LNQNRLTFTLGKEYLQAENMMGQMQQIRSNAEDYLVKDLTNKHDVTAE